MKIVVIGGSNSAQKGGYADFVRAQFPDTEMINLSVGGAPSLMGLIRLLMANNLAAGDVVILEYALNDSIYIRSKNYDETEIIKAVEHIIRYCARYKARLVPLIFNRFPEEMRGAPSSYRAKLHFLFSHYGLDFLDVSHALRRSMAVPTLDRTLYQDLNHYVREGAVVRFVADTVRDLITSGKCRISAAYPLWVTTLEIPGFLRNFPKTHLEVFKNKLLTVPLFTPEGVIEANPNKEGRIVSICCLASPKGGVVDFMLDGTILPISLVHDEPRFRRPLLKAISLPMILGREMRFTPESRIGFRWSDSREEALVDLGFASSAAGRNGKDGRIVGILVEYNRQRKPTETAAAELPPT